MAGALVHQPTGAVQPQAAQAAGNQIGALCANRQRTSGGRRSGRCKARDITLPLTVGDLLFAVGARLQHFGQYGLGHQGGMTDWIEIEQAAPAICR